ncbi:MAG: hypothetical protein ACYDEV_03230 [Acidiferrobacter sp.]
MNKLETKLAASIKPDRNRPGKKAVSEKAAGSPNQSPHAPARTPQPPAGDLATQALDLNSPDRPLHPDRIWPD